MIYPDSYWLSAYLLPFVGVSTLLWFGAWNFLSMAIIFQNFRRYLCCARLENPFKNRIFVISVKNCTLQLNFKAQFPVIKIRLINTKSRIQARWRPFFLKIFLNINFQQLFQDSAYLFLKTNYAATFPVTWCIYWHRRFSKFCNFIFGAKSG